MRAEENGFYHAAVLGEMGMHFSVNPVQLIQGQLAPGESGLVGYNDSVITALIKPGNGLQAAGDCLPFLFRLDIVIGIMVNHAIHVEYYQFHCNLEMSAVARNSWRNSFNKARRLFLSATSSHMTITSSKKAST